GCVSCTRRVGNPVDIVPLRLARRCIPVGFECYASVMRAPVYAFALVLAITVLPFARAQSAPAPAIQAALDAARRNEPHFLDEQARICEIPAPPFHEAARAREMARLFRQLGLANVHIDKAGNAIGTRPGASAHPNVVLAAHLDTVFPEGTNVAVTRKGALLTGPGIGDDCRGLAVLLAVIQSLKDANLKTPGTITFAADTGEEGLGDLRGVKELFQTDLKGRIEKFVSIDGTGLGIIDVGVGSYRYRAEFKGQGGHSFGNFGVANPIQAMGRAIAKIDAIEVQPKPRTTFNVGRVGGGTSVNSIPSECWMEVEARSSDQPSLKALSDGIKAAILRAVDEENTRWNDRGPVTVSIKQVGYRPTGATVGDSPIVQAAIAATKPFTDYLTPGEASTDANLPMSLGIPAITIGGGGYGSGAHTLQEDFDATDSYQGTQRALLLVTALAR
ncbi:MAG TPA: M20/M25/M40 family metallo-hydrolase, partial [Bryobacteraceae bacterium]|nr:M20/M25/M40 family metallo-hydrolase [Bryobacteraceae bacterium]